MASKSVWSHKTKEKQIMRASRALELRLQGYSYAAIAKMVGYKDDKKAWAVVKKCLEKAQKEPSQAVLELETQRLDKLLVGVFRVAARGDLRAIDRAVRIMERRANLLGLDQKRADAPAPEPVKHVINVVLSPEAAKTV